MNWSQVGAEFRKLTTLPAVLMTGVLTLSASVFLVVVVTSSQERLPAGLTAAQVLTETVVLLQVGFVVFGVLAASSDYPGGGLRTAFLAGPQRKSLAMAKLIATFVLLAILAVFSTVVGVVSVVFRGVVWGEGGRGAATIVALLVYLVLVGLFAYGLGTLIRSLAMALVLVLGLLLIVPALLSGWPQIARWLPTEAGLEMIGGGGLVGVATLVAWVAAAMSLGFWRFVTSDSL